MGKSMMGRTKKIEKKIHAEMTGRIDGQNATLKHNKNTDRYDLKVNGVLNLSHLSHVACRNQADNIGVDWK